jgi:hypothetical protein
LVVVGDDRPLMVPEVVPGDEPLGAGIKYGNCGWYTGPLAHGSKNPGSVLGKGWDASTSRDPQVIASWLAGTDYGLFLHAGRSGAIILDIDRPELVPDVIRHAIDTLNPPFQSTRPSNPGRGHAIFRQPPGRTIGNGNGELGREWGEVRGKNGVIVACPSVHPDPSGLYRWESFGPVPVLPQAIANMLPDAHDSAASITVSDAALAQALQSWPTGAPCAAVQRTLSRWLEGLGIGSRHDAALYGSRALAVLAAEGHRGASEALAALGQAFIRAATSQPPTRALSVASGEWAEMVRGAVALALPLTAAPRPGEATPSLADPCRPPIVEGIIAPHDRQPYRHLDMHGRFAGYSLDGERVDPNIVVPQRVERDICDIIANPDDPLENVMHPQEDAQSVDVLDWVIAQGIPLDKHETARQLVRIKARDHARMLLREVEVSQTFVMPTPMSGTELIACADDQTRWLIDGLMPYGGNVVLTAQFKTGKTTTLNQLAMSLVDGVPFLGRFDVIERQRVGILNYEMTDAQYGRWLHSLPIKNIDNLKVFGLRGMNVPLWVDPIIERMAKLIAAEGIETLIIDPLVRAMSGLDENSNADAVKLTDGIDRLKELAKVPNLIAAHHTGRVAMDVGAERSRGATRFDDWPDALWVLVSGKGDDEGVRFFRAYGRDVDVPEGALMFDSLTRMSVLGNNDGRAVRKAEGARITDGVMQNSIMSIIKDSPGIGTRGIRDALKLRGHGGATARISDLINALVSQGMVTREGEPRTGYVHYAAGAE